MKFIYKLSLKMNECTYTFERDIVLACRRKKQIRTMTSIINMRNWNIDVTRSVAQRSIEGSKNKGGNETAVISKKMESWIIENEL